MLLRHLAINFKTTNHLSCGVPLSWPETTKMQCSFLSQSSSDVSVKTPVAGSKENTSLPHSVMSWQSTSELRPRSASLAATFPTRVPWGKMNCQNIQVLAAALQASRSSVFKGGTVVIEILSYRQKSLLLNIIGYFHKYQF